MTSVVAVYVARRPDSAAGSTPVELARSCLERLRTLYPGVPVWTNAAPARDAELADLPDELRPRLLQSEDFAPARALREIFAAVKSRNHLPDGEATPAHPESAEHPEPSCAVLFDWYPLLNAELSREIEADHTQYLAHYSYSENVPIGLIPDFASAELLELLPETPPEDLRSFVFQNVDRLDLELFYRLPDLRQHRLDLSCATERSRALAARFLELKPDLRLEDLPELLRDHPEILRPYPSFIEIELTRRSDGPRPDFFPLFAPAFAEERDALEGRSDSAAEAELDPELLEKLARDIETNGFANDVSIQLGGPGEPLVHPALFSMLERLLALQQVRQIFVESYGRALNAEAFERLTQLPRADKLAIILRLSTLQPERYQKMYGAPHLPEILENVTQIEASLQGASEGVRKPQAYAEMLRLAETEDEVQAFFDRFEGSPIQPLLQKYNSYAGRLPQRRAADLSPLHRDFCWHLARDLYLSADGRVALCKQDPFARGPKSLSFREHGVAECFAAGDSAFAASLRDEHTQVPAPCLQCDEWYTFNG